MEVVKWQDVNELVKQANVTLWKLMDAINPGPDLPLILASYRYGDYIVKNGEVLFPLQKEKLVTLEHLSPTLKKLFNYNRIPLSLLLNKTAEIFSSYGDKIVPLNLLRTGQLLGLSELFPPKNLDLRNVDVSAGVRTTFLLPNVSDSTHHKKLANIYQASYEVNSIFDHWHIFKKIANYRFHHRHWSCDLLFFSHEWFDRLVNADTVVWLQLKNYFLEQAWRQTPNLFQHYNNMYLRNLLLNMMSNCQTNLSEYAINVIKYIFWMQRGCLPGFQISDGSEDYLPERVIQAAYVQDYKLKTYLPAIVHSAIWEGINKQAPLYYSLNLPIVFSRIGSLRITELLQQIKMAIQHLGLVEHGRYRYMHQQAQPEQDVELASDVLVSDPRIIELKARYPERKISSSNTFVRGCIQVVKKD